MLKEVGTIYFIGAQYRNNGYAAGFVLTEKRMYKDLNDDKEEQYHFYEIIK